MGKNNNYTNIYYISPQICWKESRIKIIKVIDKMFVILPFKRSITK